MTERQPILSVQNLQLHYPIREGLFRRQTGAVRVIDGISFDVYPGETLAIVGETGVGKTTLGRTIMQLIKPTGGQVVFQGQPLTSLNSGQLRAVRQKLQMLFQDPYAALNPRMTIGALLDEPLTIHNLGNTAVRQSRINDLLAQVGMNPYTARHYPNEFSGGQRQRVGIARALATAPAFLIADEPVSALDPAVRAHILNLLQTVQAEHNLGILFLSPDLNTVRGIADRIAIFYGGQIVELAEAAAVVQRPLHPYTQALAAALPASDDLAQEARRQRVALTGKVADPANFPAACRFHPRCPHANDICRQQTPEFRNLGTPERPHHVACHHANQFL